LIIWRKRKQASIPFVKSRLFLVAIFFLSQPHYLVYQILIRHLQNHTYSQTDSNSNGRKRDQPHAVTLERTERREVKRAVLSEFRPRPYSARMFIDHHLGNAES